MHLSAHSLMLLPRVYMGMEDMRRPRLLCMHLLLYLDIKHLFIIPRLLSIMHLPLLQCIMPLPLFTRPLLLQYTMLQLQSTNRHLLQYIMPLLPSTNLLLLQYTMPLLQLQYTMLQHL